MDSCLDHMENCDWELPCLLQVQARLIHRTMEAGGLAMLIVLSQHVREYRFRAEVPLLVQTFLHTF